jgi:FKBP-type peptidyl-prolyl cis-trans isomerase FkpA
MYGNLNLSFLGAFVLIMSLTSCASIREPDFTTTDIMIGSGAEAVAGKMVAVQYSGWLYDADKPNHKGKRFDASEPGKPFIFKLGAGRVIKGWDMGVPGMKVGGKRTLVIPSDLGYGRRGAGDRIPPDSSLIFDIELLEVR